MLLLECSYSSHHKSKFPQSQTRLHYIIANNCNYVDAAYLLPVFQVVVVLLYVSVLLALYVVPLHITSPCIMDPATLKPRPAVIGHQGAPMVSQLMPSFHSE